MINWKNMDTLAAYKELQAVKPVEVAKVMAGENGAERVRTYSAPMGAGMNFNYGARPVDADVLAAMQKFADEAQLAEKFQALYNGEVINTGEKRLVLHHLCRGQLGEDVIADGVNKRAFYAEQQKNFTAFANKVLSGEITNENGEKFTTVVQSGIGGSDLGPRAIYLALENWAKAKGPSEDEGRIYQQRGPRRRCRCAEQDRRCALHLCPGFQVRHYPGNPDQRVLCEGRSG